MLRISLPWSICTLAALTTSCTTGGEGNFDAAMVSDAQVVDPFDPANTCGLSVAPTERVPGAMVIAIDRSASMALAPDDSLASEGNPSKWDLAAGAINRVLADASDEVSVGVLLFPTTADAQCAAAFEGTLPQVAVAPLQTNRSEIESALAAGPQGSVTPIFAALSEGFDVLDALDSNGRRGLVLVTDGQELCAPEDAANSLAAVMAANQEKGYLTFAVGLGQGGASCRPSPSTAALREPTLASPSATFAPARLRPNVEGFPASPLRLWSPRSAVAILRPTVPPA